jgi:hypothetical protein
MVKTTLEKNELQENNMILTDTVCNITYFLHQLCTQCFVFHLSNKLRKPDLKYFLVTEKKKGVGVKQSLYRS